MPRKTKDLKNIEEKDEKTTKKSSKKSTTKKASVSSKKVEKKDTKKTTKTNKSKSKVINNTKTNNSKKSTNKKNSTNTKKAIKKQKPIVESVEYYDLPYRYNQTVVKLLAQTPNNLFIYWDISDEDVNNYKKVYGDNFFEKTKPVLIVHNETMNYSFEIDINDFANCWYVQVNDSKCDYKIELGRRPIVFNEETNINLPNNYIHICSSNNMISPNDKILFNINPENIIFKNIKTNSIERKSLSNALFMPHLNKMLKIYNIYDLYKKLYNDENLEDVFNPSSGNFTSKFM